MGKQPNRANRFIRITDKTKKTLDELKSKRETYEDVIERLLSQSAAPPVTIKEHKK